MEAAALSTNGEREGAVVLRHTVIQDFFCAREYQNHETRMKVRKTDRKKGLLEAWWLVRAMLMHSHKVQLRSKSEYKHFSTIILNSIWSYAIDTDARSRHILSNERGNLRLKAMVRLWWRFTVTYQYKTLVLPCLTVGDGARTQYNLQATLPSSCCLVFLSKPGALPLFSFFV